MILFDHFMSQVYFGNTMDRYLYFFLIIICAIVMARIVYYFFKSSARRIAKKTKTTVDDVIIDFIEEPITLLFVVGGVFFAFKMLVLTTSVTTFVGQVVPTPDGRRHYVTAYNGTNWNMNSVTLTNKANTKQEARTTP